MADKFNNFTRQQKIDFIRSIKNYKSAIPNTPDESISGQVQAAFEPTQEVQSQIKPTREEIIANIRRLRASGQAANVLGTPRIVNEANPDITFKERFLAKNLGGSLQDQVKYLKSQHPNLDIKIYGKDIIAKKPTDKSYTKLDPSTMELSDISDVLYDIGSGIVEGTGALLGGTAGAALGTLVAPAAGTVVGGTTGAIAGGGAAGAGMEYLRQKLGQAAGVHGELSPSDIKLAGALGATNPLLFGATKIGGKQIIKGAIPKAIEYGKNAIKEGALSTASLLSGIKKPVIKTAIAQEQVVKELSSPDKLVKFVDDAYDEVWKPAKKAVNDLGAEHSAALATMDKKIKIGEYNKAIRDNYAAKIRDIRSNPIQRGAGELKDVMDEVKSISQIIPRANEIDAKSTASLLDRLREKTKPWVDPSGKTRIPTDNEVSILRGLEKTILKQMPENVRMKALAYGEAKDALGEISKKFGTAGRQKDVSLIKGLMSENTIDAAPVTASINFLEKLTNKDNLTKAKQTVQAVKEFGAYEPMSGRSRTLFKTPAAYIGGGIGGAVGRKFKIGGGDTGGGAGALIGTSLGALTGWGLSRPSALLKYAHAAPYLGWPIRGLEASGRTFKRVAPNSASQILMNLQSEPYYRNSKYDNLGQ